jgi:hypothetical protein
MIDHKKKKVVRIVQKKKKKKKKNNITLSSTNPQLWLLMEIDISAHHSFPDLIAIRYNISLD